KYAKDEELQDRVDTAAGAVNIHDAGDNVAGMDRLLEVWGDEVAETLSKWRFTQASGKQAAPAFSDEALALQFAERHASELKFVALRSKWFRWNECRWSTDDTLASFDNARAICREQASHCKQGATALASAKTVAACVSLARADRRIAATI